jgi:predicted enzyme related to lactoylglutathione lyase
MSFVGTAGVARVSSGKLDSTDKGEERMNGVRYVHTNLIARDWRTLASFYQRLFGCVPVPPERNYAGPSLEAGTGIPGAMLQGVHLRLPGHGSDGPTLEIYSYSRLADGLAPAVNRPGLAHIAFEVPSVPDARDEVLSAGGRAIGEIVTLTTSAGARVTWCYVADPEGNIIELEAWS